MTEQVWISLATLCFLIVSGCFGWFWKLLFRISARLTELGDKVDIRAAALDANLKELLDVHERRDNDRHVEVVQRLTRVETIVINNGNGHTLPRSAYEPLPKR